MSDTREIALRKGYVALVDAADFEAVGQFRWRAKPNHGEAHVGVVKTYVFSRATGYLHRFLMEAPSGLQVDHINGDGLDNRRANLRLCTQAENLRYRPYPISETGFRGVRTRGSRFRAVIKHGGRTRSLGGYAQPEEAARAYDEEARRLFGQFAWLNFPGIK